MFSDGKMFLEVRLVRNNHSDQGNTDYCLLNIYDAHSGEFVQSLGSASYYISLGGVYIINGKRTLIVHEYNNYLIATKTHIYSFGEQESSVEDLSSETDLSPTPVITFDLNGRVLENSSPGIITITKMSDGSTKKELIN